MITGSDSAAGGGKNEQNLKSPVLPLLTAEVISTLKVSEKGAVSLYGLGRFPVTLYQEQWEKILDMAKDIRVFIAEHEDELKTKEKEG